METNTYYYAGIDIGSTTVKLVLLNEAGEMVWGEYRRHCAHTQETLAEMMREARKKLGACRVKVRMTGSGAISLAEALRVGFVQEVVAVAEALQKAAPQTDVAIELGGEDAKIIYFTGGLEERMNGVCAGGTGSFIDQMAALLKTDAPGLNELAKRYHELYPIAARCGVFAKSDIQPLINEGAAREDLAASIFQAVVNQTISGLACGKPIRGHVAFWGGPLHFLSELRQAFVRTLHFENGIFDAEQMAAAVRDSSNIHFPPTGLICVEEPLATGKVVPLNVLQEVYRMAQQKGIPVHMDGARIFNAATALGVDVKEIAACADSVMFCLSKGLCAPVGSMLVGSKEYIDRARRNRKMLGGGMRQCGFLAAAGLVALDVMTKRLGEDHENARYMAQRLQKMPGVSLDLDAVEINMVFFKLDAPQQVIDTLPQKMYEQGIKINGIEDGEFRFVTTNDTSRQDIDHALDVFEQIITQA